MDEAEKTLEKRKQRLKSGIFNKFKSRYDILALLVIIATAIFRYYYLFKTKTQALWWDEATYFVMARNWALDTIPYPEPFRDWFVSFIWSIFIRLGTGEFGLRFLTVTVGILSFFFFYQIVSYFFGKRIGIISLVLAVIFYEPIFWSLRLDVGTYSIFFMLVSFYFMTRAIRLKEKAYDKRKIIYFSLAAAFSVFAFVAHAPGIFSILVYIVFIPIYTRFKFYKSKKFWITLLVFFIVLSPFIAKNFITSGQMYPRYQEGWVERGGQVSFDSFKESLTYITTIPQTIGLVVFVVFLLGLVLSLDIFLVADKILKQKLSKENTGKLFFILFGLISLALGMQSLFLNKGGAYFEPRYILPFYFACFVFAGIGIDFIARKIRKNINYVALIFVIVLLAFAAYTELGRASNLINNKAQSYQGIKQSGLWLGQNTNENDIIISNEAPQIVYYSGRQTIGLKITAKVVEKQILEHHPRYINVWAGKGQKIVTEILTFMQENQDSIKFVASFPQGAENPSVWTFEVQSSFYGEPENEQGLASSISTLTESNNSIENFA